jgi:hypothetical protein
MLVSLSLLNLAHCLQHLRSFVLFWNSARGDCVKLFQILSSSDRPCVYRPSCIEAAVKRVSSVVTGALNQVIPFNYTKELNFQDGFPAPRNITLIKRLVILVAV